VLIGAVLAIALVAAVASMPTPAGAAETVSGSTIVTTPGGAALKLNGTGVGFSVSWLPTTSPVQATPGQMASGTFYVTNQTTSAIPVVILAGTAVPGNNGALQVQSGADARFPKVVYSPDSFVSQPKSTTTVLVTVTTPSDLAPGIYIIPAVVQPSPPKSGGNIQILQEIDALVTFQVPGATKANLKPSFVGSGGSVTTHHLPGLPPIQVATSGNEVLRVLNNSPTALYSYNELTATQTPFGAVVFKGHTAGDPHDLRNDVALYFPNRYRDYPVSWHPSLLGVGNAHITAYVSYHPNPSEVAQKETSIELLVISPLWILAPVAVLSLLVLLTLRRRKNPSRAEQVRRSVSSRVAQVIGSLILIFIAVVGAFLSSTLLFAVVSLVGVVVAAVMFIVGRRRSRLSMVRGVAIYDAFIGIVLVAAAVSVVLSLVSTQSADIAVAFVAGASIWTLLGWWLQWWNEERQDGAPAKSMDSDLPGIEEDPAPSASGSFS
jgi:hypothetical protein